MARTRSRKAFGIVVALGLAAAVTATAVALVGRDGGDDSQQSHGPALTTTMVEQRPLAEYLEVAGTLDYSGSVTLTAQTSGVLVDLAPEGSVVSQGQPLYQIVNEPTEADTAEVLNRLAAARNSLVAARDDLSDAVAGPSESDVAAAEAALTDALEALDRLLEPPSEAEIASAEAAVDTASEALDDLLDPSPAARSEARSRLSSARSDLADLLAGASPADIEGARAAVRAAQSDLDDLLAGASRAEIDAARASLLAAEEALAAVDASDTAIEAAEADLALARQALSDLLAGPSNADIAVAEAAVLVAEDGADQYRYYPDDHPQRVSAVAELALARQALADLLAGASSAEVDAAAAAVLVAQEALADLLAGASSAEVDAAAAAVLVAQEALADLLAGASPAEVDAAAAAVSSASEALADLLGGASEAELDAAEAAVESASEALDHLENPTDGARAAARASLATAQEALADLLADPTAAEVDLAEAAVGAASEALADLRAGASPDEIEALEASVAAAEASVVSAEADLAALIAGRGSLAVMYGSSAVYRTMTVGLEGDDVRQLEENLADLGHAGDGFSTDGVFDDATAAAVADWQRSTGQDADATVGTADIVFVAGPVRIGSWTQGVEVGQQLAVGASLASLTVIEAPVDGRMSTTQRVVALVPLSDRDLVSEGIAVNVELPDGTDIGGSVTAINPSPILDDQTGENAVEATILLVEPASEVWIGATVDVEITETLIEDALVVPATALLALVEGGYAVEVVAEDGSVRLVGVETGLFVDGDVEVVSTEITAGTTVVVPR